MKKRMLFLIFLLCTLAQACKSIPLSNPSATQKSNIPSSATLIPSKSPTFVPSITHTNTPVSIVSSTSTVNPTTTASTTPVPSETAVANSITGTNLVIDHNSVLLFDQIPQEYILAASELIWLHRHASVGVNIRFGLDCLSNFFPDRPDLNNRPFACDKNIDDEKIIFDTVYNSKNWEFEVHALPNPNPGWNNKTIFFIDRIDSLEPNNRYDYASYNMGYVEDETITKHFFSNTSPDDNFPSVMDLEKLESRHPEITNIWWTIALARNTEPHILEFNQKMREYASSNNKILMDIADIKSYRPDGTPCKGVELI